jgi:hypothetical protein
MSIITGGCLCGSIRYQSNTEPQMIVACHCSTCQKNTGSAFSLNLAMPEDQVTIQGDTLGIYEERSSPDSKPFYRSFCTRCGSPISGRGEAYPGVVFLKAGTLDDPSWVKPNAHMWCDEKQPWFSIEEGVPQFAQAPE